MAVFESSDGSKFKILSARELSTLPIWGGNRVLDEEHVKRIKQTVGANVHRLNLNPFRIAGVIQEDGTCVSYIIDGQHRCAVIREYFKTERYPLDFNVLVAGKIYNNEDEIIESFKVLNTTRSIAWKEDPNLCANKYIEALMVEFNKDKKRPLIKNGKTARPFASVDKLRITLVNKRVNDWTETPDEFVERAKSLNMKLLEDLRPRVSRDMEVRALDYNFALGLDDTYGWV
jgi:hypothetical protein